MSKSSNTAEAYEKAQRLLDRRRYSEAFTLYEHLAKAGDPRCQVVLGWMYNEGLGVAKDREKALHFFQVAASLGSGEGQFYSGRWALSGGNYKEALDWFHRATAQHEYGPALLWLGLMYIRGLGLATDIEKGVSYLERASKTGNIAARRELAGLMIRGRLGVAKVPAGIVLFLYNLIAAMVIPLVHGHSDKLIS